jgi:Ca2+-binding EF-hand superfamily protein
MKQASIVSVATVAIMAGLVSAQPPSSFESGGSGQHGQPPAPQGLPPNALFDAIDADRDGAISVRELRKAVVALKQFDADQDGKITRDEAQGGPPNPQAVLRRLMENDKDGDGKLSKSELPRHLASQLKTADTNGDGAIDRAELANVMQPVQPQFGAGGGVGNGGLGGGGFRGQGGFNGDPRPGVNLSQYDRNGDGQLSADEMPAQMRGVLRGTDQNGDGQLSPQELQAIQQRMNERIRGQRPLPPGVTVGPQGVSGTPQSR